MQRIVIATVVLSGLISTVHTAAASDPNTTIRHSEQVLGELMSIPGRQIPQRLLNCAQGVVIVPDVIKVGFVAGVRRGHGVVMVRDVDGEWSLPQFLTLTGGSVGWQAGIQGTDVVLVFTTRKGVDHLLRGKFTIGVDAAATAGPVGRNAEIATDALLKSEIWSYSRSRGLFLGVAIDGSVLDVEQDAHPLYYGVPFGHVPQRLPESAARLRNFLTEVTHSPLPQPVGNGPVGNGPVPLAQPSIRIENLRRLLAQNATNLHAILNPDWRTYLAFPKEMYDQNGQPNVELLVDVQNRFAQIESSPNYRQLSERPEFIATYELLREYVDALTAAQPNLELPPPPAR